MTGPHFGAVRHFGLVLLSAIAMASAPAFGQSNGIVDEVKVGVLDHDVGIFGTNVEKGAQINGEVLFTSPDLFKVIGSPRPILGVAGNTAGTTSYAYVDMTLTPMLWQNLLQPDDGIYAGGFLGGAIHDGNLSETTHDKKALGTRALYHVGAEGGYQITSTYSVEGYFAHLSNAGAARHNGGLNDVGVRAGFKVLTVREAGGQGYGSGAHRVRHCAGEWADSRRARGQRAIHRERCRLHFPRTAGRQPLRADAGGN